jgi:hypothetical protein
VECGEACEQATRRAAADGRRRVEPAGGCEPHHRGDDAHRLSGADDLTDETLEPRL